MKSIQIEDDLYHYIASKTENIGESASAILRRLLIEKQDVTSAPVLKPLVESEDVEGEPIDVETGHSVFNILNKEEVAVQKGAVGRFLFVLAALHRCHPQSFHRVLEVRGKARAYFATSAEELEKSGSSIKPKTIPDSEYWVTTNNNTPRKKLIITQTAQALGYDQTETETLRELI